MTDLDLTLTRRRRILAYLIGKHGHACTACGEPYQPSHSRARGSNIVLARRVPVAYDNRPDDELSARDYTVLCRSCLAERTHILDQKR